MRRDNTTNNNKNKAISSATTEKRIVEKRRKSARVLCVSIFFFSIISVRNVCVFGQCFVGDLRDVFAISWWGIDRVSFFGGDR